MTVYRSSPAEAIDATALRLMETAPVELNEDWAATKLADAAQRLIHDEGLLQALVSSTGLSEPMVRWGLQTTLETVTAEVLLEIRHQAGLFFFGEVNRARLCSVVLAGNVFTACLKAMLVPLLLEVPVLVRASSRDDVLAHALAGALPPPYDTAIAVVSFPRDDEAAWTAFFRHADTAHVFGSDETLHALRAMTPLRTRFVGHGHGVGIAALLDPHLEPLEHVAQALALDVAAYDQRGCLSPQVAYVVGETEDAVAFAQALHRSLGQLETSLLRGPLPRHERVACTTWRATVSALADIYESVDHAVVVRGDASLPPGPGYRHIVVQAVPSIEALRDRLAPLAHHLKAFGFAPRHDEARELVANALPPGTAPYLAPMGSMQTPPFDLPWDGMPLTEGLLWFLG